MIKFPLICLNCTVENGATLLTVLQFTVERTRPNEFSRAKQEAPGLLWRSAPVLGFLDFSPLDFLVTPTTSKYGTDGGRYSCG